MASAFSPGWGQSLTKYRAQNVKYSAAPNLVTVASNHAAVYTDSPILGFFPLFLSYRNRKFMLGSGAKLLIM